MPRTFVDALATSVGMGQKNAAAPKSRWCIGICLATVAVASECRARRAADGVEFHDVTVVDVHRGAEIPNQDVIVRGSKIVAIGRFGDSTPRGVLVVDGTGRFLIPGLWDMHVHVADDPHALGLLLAAGITGARDMGGDLHQVLANRKETETGAIAGPRLIVAGPKLAGPPSEEDSSTWVIRTPAEAIKAVSTLAAEGVDFIKVHDHLSRAAYEAIAKTAEAHHLPFAGHVSEYITPLEASADGQMSIEHFEYLPKQCMRLFDPRLTAAPAGCDSASVMSLMHVFAKNGTWLTPTAQAFRFFAPNDWPTIRKKYQNLAVLIRSAGVRILAGTDQSSYLESKGSVPGASLHDELNLLEEAGFSPIEALRSATVSPAEFLHITSEVGDIEVGKDADLVLLEADPLRTIRNTERIAGVMRLGKFYDAKTLADLKNAH